MIFWTQDRPYRLSDARSHKLFQQHRHFIAIFSILSGARFKINLLFEYLKLKYIFRDNLKLYLTLF